MHDGPMSKHMEFNRHGFKIGQERFILAGVSEGNSRKSGTTPENLNDLQSEAVPPWPFSTARAAGMLCWQ